VAKQLKWFELGIGVRLTTEHSYSALDTGLDPLAERETTPGGRVLNLKNFRLACLYAVVTLQF